MVRNELALHQAIAVYSDERDQIQDAIEAQLVSKFANNDLVLQDVFLRNVQFSDSVPDGDRTKADCRARKRAGAILSREGRVREAACDYPGRKGRLLPFNSKGKHCRKIPKSFNLEYVRKLAPGTKAIITDSDKISNPGGFAGR